MAANPSENNLNVTDGLAASGPGSSPQFSPLYQQIKGLIMQGLEQGEWKPGEMIPSETDLATRFKVSQGTVRKAIDELSSENLLVRRQGKGTFVATHDEARVQFRFLRLMPNEGAQTAPESKIVECNRMRAPSDIARLLEAKPGDTLVLIRRVLSFAGKPTILEEIWLPGTLFKGLTTERLNEYKGPMYGLFEMEFGTKMIRADEMIRAVSAGDEAAQYLAVNSNEPVLLIERVSFTYGERPVEVRRGRYLTRDFYYSNQLS
ncbi:MAG: GntR family transcriptional regulator [Burkholderiaceae bacterium]|nr:MAG: GntR family transcriptional regulator [Burkholderiaceae bacterium]